MYQKDIEELEKLIKIAERPNIKPQIEDYKNNLSHLMSEEKKKLESDKRKNKMNQIKEILQQKLEKVHQK
jgi:hypothetical protein